jgi:translation initiation factor 3 subunit D
VDLCSPLTRRELVFFFCLLGFFEGNIRYERVNTKNDRPLDKSDILFPKVTTRFGTKCCPFFPKLLCSDDPHIRTFASQGAGTVFATDAILAVLMSCPRSVYPFDVVANRVGNMLFFDKRDGSGFDYVTVGETALNPPEEDGPDSMNNKVVSLCCVCVFFFFFDESDKDALAKEATIINQAFSQQVVDKNATPLKFDHPDPFAGEGEEVAKKGYLYRRWDLEDGHKLVARCEVDGFVKGVRGVDEMITINALNEYDPKAGMDWRRTVDSQGGAVLAAELKSNANKLAQWTVRAILAGAEKMLFGFVSRVRVKDAGLHAVLATQSYKTMEFARQIALRTSNMWGILKVCA